MLFYYVKELGFYIEAIGLLSYVWVYFYCLKFAEYERFLIKDFTLTHFKYKICFSQSLFMSNNWQQV